MIHDLINQVRKENLYRHILQLEGIRHPIFNPAGLCYAIEYIKNELKESLYDIKEHSFTTNRFSGDFMNIEAHSKATHTTGKPILYISAHYDTILHSPGANDNASGIAVLLEVARILSYFRKKENVHTDIRFICFALEERMSINELQHMFNFFHIIKTNNQGEFYSMLQKIKTIMQNKQPVEDICRTAFTLLSNNKSHLDPLNYKCIEALIKAYRDMATDTSHTHRQGLTGSTHFVEESIKNNSRIFSCINLETIGYSSNADHSQLLPPGINPSLMQSMGILSRYKTKKNLSKGNFICIMCDKNSSALGKIFYKNTKRKEIRLPSTLFSLPLTHTEIDQQFPDMLRSDHAPFWKYNIPALFITDTANFRYPYYHTEADTIDKLDFDFMEKVCKTVIATVIKTCV